MKPELLEIRATDNVATAVRYTYDIKYVANAETYDNKDISQIKTIEYQIENQEPKIIEGVGNLYIVYFYSYNCTGQFIQEVYVIVRTHSNEILSNLLEF